jgi:hypothetical protein
MRGGYAMAIDNLQNLMEVLKQILKSCEDEYNYCNQSFQALDSKANATGGISGILLAATFAFVEQFKATENNISLIFLILIILLLILSMSFSVLSMWVKKIKSPPISKLLFNDVIGLYKEGGLGVIEKRIDDIYGQQIRNWFPAIDSFINALNRKGKRLKFAQRFLVVASLSIAILTVISITNKFK